jgi:hypothetical protein
MDIADVVADLRVAGCVFAEDEADILIGARSCHRREGAWRARSRLRYCPVAVSCAIRNLCSYGVCVYRGDLFGALPARLRGRVDVLVANPPYMPTDEIRLMPAEARDHEPRIALDGGRDGLPLHRRVAREVNSWLAPGGRGAHRDEP